MRSLILSLRMLKGRFKLLALSLVLIILASSLVIGIFLTTDYFIYTNAHEKYRTLQVDYIANTRFANRPTPITYDYLKSGLLDIEGVSDVHYLFDVPIYNIDILVETKNRTYRIEEIGLLLLGIDFNEPFWRDNIALVGNDSRYPTNKREVIVDYTIAQWMNLSVGDVLNITQYAKEIPLGFDLIVVGFFHARNFMTYHLTEVEKIIFYGAFITDPETALDIVGTLYTTPLFYFRYFVWIHRDEIINPWDRRTTLKTLGDIEIEIHKTLVGTPGVYYAEIDHPIITTMREFYNSAENYSSQFVLAVLIIFIFVALTTIIGGELTIETRRKEIGLLKIRGSSNKKIDALMISEWLTIGILGGFIGFLISPPVAFILISYISPYLASRYSVIQIVLSAMSQYLVLSVVLGLVLSMLSVILPTRRVADIKPLEAVQDYYEAEELSLTKGINRKMNAFFTLLGVYAIFEFLYGMPVITAFLNLARAWGTSVLINLAEILWFLEAFIMPLLAPFLIILGAENLIISYSDKLSKVFSAITKPLIGPLSIIASKNFGRKPTRTALVVFLLTLTLVTNIVFGSGIATAKNHMVVETKMAVGADIKIEITSLRPFDFINRSIVSEITKINGIDYVIRAFIKDFGRGLATVGALKAVAIDPIYFKQKFYDDSYLSHITSEEAFELLSSGENVIINIGAAETLGIDLNNEIVFKDPYRPSVELLSTLVVGYYKFLPGIFEDMLTPQRAGTTVFAVINIDIIWPLLEEKRVLVVPDRTFIFVTVKDKSRIKDIVNQIENILTTTETDAIITILNQKITETLETEFSGALLSLYEAGIIYSSTLIILVIFLAVGISIYERRRELALLRVRGFLREKIAKMLLGESLLIILISLSVGLPIAMLIVASWISGTTMVLPYLKQYLIVTGQYEYPKEWALLVVPSSLIMYLTLVLVCFTLSYIIPYLIISRNPLPEEVRIHH